MALAPRLLLLPAVAFLSSVAAVRPQSGYQWNQKAFSLVYELFQMTVFPVVNVGPAITIAK
jgi:hypothetical protein